MVPKPWSPDGSHEACRDRAIVPCSNLVEDPWIVPGDARLRLPYGPGEQTRNNLPAFAWFVDPLAYFAICFRAV